MKFMKTLLLALALISPFLFELHAQDFKKEMAAIRASYSHTPDRSIEGTGIQVRNRPVGDYESYLFSQNRKMGFGGGLSLRIVQT
jgi:hypothetical protein